MVMKPGSPPPKKKKPEAKGMLGWMAGKPAAKSSGKGMFVQNHSMPTIKLTIQGPKKAEPDPCVVM